MARHLPLLQDPDPTRRRETIETFFEQDCSPDVAVQITGLLEDSDRGVRDAAAQFVLSHPMPEVIQRLAAFITSNNIVVRNLAGDLLIKIGAPAVDSLADYIDHPNKDVRKFAIDLLAQMPAQSLGARIAGRLADPDPNVICAAVDAIGMLGLEDYSERLLDLYQEKPYVRPNVVAAVRHFPHRVDNAFFETALQDEDPVVQLAAAEAIAEKQDASLLGLLIREAERVNALARPVILQAIVNSLRSAANPPKLPESLKPYFIQMLDDLDVNYLKAAVQGLLFFPADASPEYLIPKIGLDEELDLLIFQVFLRSGFRIIPALVRNMQARQLNIDAGSQFIIGLIAHLSDEQKVDCQFEEIQEALHYIEQNFMELNDETKMAVMEIARGMDFPCLGQLVLAALKDPDPSIQNYALEILHEKGEQLLPRETVRQALNNPEISG